MISALIQHRSTTTLFKKATCLAIDSIEELPSPGFNVARYRVIGKGPDENSKPVRGCQFDLEIEYIPAEPNCLPAPGGTCKGEHEIRVLSEFYGEVK